MWYLEKKNKWGFTLIELLIVVAIIGILAAIAVPQYLRARDDARNKATLENAQGSIGVLTTETEYQMRSGIDGTAAAAPAVVAFVKGGAALVEPLPSTIEIRGVRPADNNVTPEGLPAYLNNGNVYPAVAGVNPYQTMLGANDGKAPVISIFPNLNKGDGTVAAALTGWPKDARVD